MMVLSETGKGKTVQMLFTDACQRRAVHDSATDLQSNEEACYDSR